MKQTATQTIDETIQAWDLYCAGNYEKILRDYENHESDDLQDLRYLARLERDGQGVGEPGSTSLFSALAAGMKAYHERNHKLSSTLLGGWLLNKNYYSTEVLNRFFHSSRESRNHSLQLSVSRKFLEIKNYQSVVVQPLFHSLFHLGKHEDALKVFEKFREQMDDQSTLQKAAYSMMQLRRYQDAERMLVAFYEKITGHSYELHYEAVKKRYTDSIQKIPELEKKRDLSYDETMQLGMAYLFNNQYQEALKLFNTMVR